jgi:hypothetical protein
MVWLCRSPIPVGRRGVILHVQIFLPAVTGSVEGGWGGGGVGTRLYIVIVFSWKPCVKCSSRSCIDLQPRKEKRQHLTSSPYSFYFSLHIYYYYLSNKPNKINLSMFVLCLFSWIIMFYVPALLCRFEKWVSNIHLQEMLLITKSYKLSF